MKDGSKLPSQLMIYRRVNRKTYWLRLVLLSTYNL
jgi:hypothetical protein